MCSISQMYFDQGRAEGKAEGRREGRAEGKAEGEAKGRREGKAEGRREGKAEGRREGKAEGHTSGLLESIRALHKNLKKTFEEAMDLLNVPTAKRGMYLELLKAQIS